MRRTVWLYLVLMGSYAAADVYRVPGDFETILDAYRAAANGDTILVAPGEYHGDGWCEVQLFNKSVHVISEKGPHETIIDGWGVARGFLLMNIPDDKMLIEGFTFRDCVGTMTGAVNFFEKSPATLRNCIVIRGRATSRDVNLPGEGGGIRIWGSSPVIEDCIIQDCSAIQGGGFNLLEHSNPIIRRCIITGNEGSGMQISTYCNPVIEDCLISNNTGSSISWSGGVGILDHSNAIVRRCIISDNVSEWSGGAGIRVDLSSPRIENCFITGNHTSLKGAAVICHSNAFPKFFHCTIAHNISDLGSHGIASMLNSRPEFYGCIIWNPGGPQFFYENQGEALAEYCNILQYFEGAGNFYADPKFAGQDDYHLTSFSPCIDRVIDYGVAWDADSEERSGEGSSDAGADEYSVLDRLRAEVDMPSHLFKPGDDFYIRVKCHNDGAPWHNIILFAVLQMGDSFFCSPSWGPLDFQVVSVGSPETTVNIVPPFVWPRGLGTFSGVSFHAVMTDALKQRLFGDISSWEFGWEESSLK